jgi:hypothetical protein
VKPVYIFRDQLDLTNKIHERQKEVVEKIFDATSLSQVQLKERGITDRANQVFNPSERSNLTNRKFAKTVNNFKDQMSKSFYNGVSYDIQTDRTQGL